jgi:hypothetical protein
MFWDQGEHMIQQLHGDIANFAHTLFCLLYQYSDSAQVLVTIAFPQPVWEWWELLG